MPLTDIPAIKTGKITSFIIGISIIIFIYFFTEFKEEED
ncbi:hypothetical protein J2S74_002689 [Evansella vedderi]|uniref:Uncharacterized protein n=1 Tax=Evansella vedderi TaxID=38282 RepID=A0ABT9ZVP8_9BACI|nr:hypothetical protein [Evansella vedderi]